MTSDPESFYDSLGEGEWERTEKNFTDHVERQNTKRIIESLLPDEGRILDAGGASGRYAVWLARNKYEVELVNRSQRQVELAREKAEEMNVSDRIDVFRKDIRDISYSEEFDAVLCLGGALSHILDEEERRSAAENLLNAARNGAPVATSVMGFHGILLQAVTEQNGFLENISDFLQRQKYDEQLVEGIEDDPWFADTFFFRPGQLRKLVEEAGGKVQEVKGLENAVTPAEKQLRDQEYSEELEDPLQKLSRRMLDETAGKYMSKHLIATGHKDS